jgi:Ca2+-binding RTX toxin-like protein
MPINNPVITSNGGKATAAISVNEGVTTVATFTATDAESDPLSYRIVGGSDRSKFKIDAITGVLTFIAPPDFEKMTDFGKNNVYDVIVEVSDGTLTDTQTLSVKIKDVAAVTRSGTAGDDVLGPLTMTVEGDTLNGLGGNDTLDGGIGADTMNGGSGDDTFIVDNIGDVIGEGVNEGTDLVKASVSYSIAGFANVENLTLTGAAAINGTGNGLNNTLTGNTGNNKLDGGTGNDTMIGGAGNDTYTVDSASDVVTELDGEGIDTVISGVALTLTEFLENLTLTGTSAINGTGNAANNKLIGNGASNTLTGLGGTDTLDGGGGADVLIGGAGNDTYVVDTASDSITELLNEGIDLVKASASYSLASFANVENLTLTGSASINATGNALNNVLTGNSGANTLTGNDGNDTLIGGTGADVMVGGIGDDEYRVDNAGDVVTEGATAGTDTVVSTISYSIASLANVENITLSGSATTATGNAGNNVLIGNTAVNTLTGGDGNDTLDGMGGIDTMIGGKGDDVYTVGSAGETITEAAGEGIDLINSSVSWTLGANIEKLSLLGLSAINATGNSLDNVLTGNIGVNTLTGNDGNDILDGGRGNDKLIGGAGNDTYYVGESGDVVTELANGGTDTVITTYDGYILASEVENLTINALSNSSIDVTGNSVANIITGNSGWNILDGADGNDTLIGGAGADTLIGGAGVDIMTGGADFDTFTFKALTDSGTAVGSRDSITDFSTGELINLTAIDANSVTSLNQEFSFGAGADNVYGAGELQVSISGNVATVSLYVDANAVADMVFTVTMASGTTTLSASDFVL